jgi:hypothetical protein
MRTSEWYAGKRQIAEQAFDRGLDMLHEGSSATHVAEILAIHKLIEVLKECEGKHETTSSGL